MISNETMELTRPDKDDIFDDISDKGKKTPKYKGQDSKVDGAPGTDNKRSTLLL